MHYGIILLICFFHAAVLYSPSTTVDASKRESLLSRNGNLEIQSTLWNQAVMLWRLNRKFTGNLTSLRLFYRPRLRQITLASLEWDEKENFYVAKSAVEEFSTTEGWHSEDETELNLHNDQSIEFDMSVRHLLFHDTDYVFEARRTELSESGRTITEYARTVARTKHFIPKHSPKTGIGAFSILTVSGSSRIVKIYWQGLDEGKYKVRVYEEAEWRTAQTNVGVLEDGHFWSTISLKSHYFELCSYSDAGSSAFSFVYIPDQSNVWSPPKSVAFLNTKEGAYWYTLTWDKPDYANDVTNYTVFWFDPLLGLSSDGFYDFVHVPSNQTSFEVRADGYMALGLSASGDISSSGIHIVEVN